MKNINTSSAFSSTQSTLLITNKQLIEAIASMSTDLAAKNIQAEGLDPADEHCLSVSDYADDLIRRGIKLTQGDRIRLGQAAAMQGHLAGRLAVVVERVVNLKCGLRKKVLVKLHAPTSLNRAATCIGLI